MNSRSERNTLHCVRTLLTLRPPCIVFVLLLLACIYCFSPLSYCPVVPTTDADAPVIDYVVDDRVPLPSSFQASRAIPLSHISPTYLYLYVALGICCCYFNPIQLHSLSLSPLDYFPISYVALYIKIVFSSAPCALLVIG